MTTGRESAASATRPGGDAEWWREAVVYQIYPRSFNDSDGDGIGDIPGIIEKLDYIEDLGVDAVWLNPVYVSPMVDMGYDIADYRAIDDLFGTMDDWRALRDGLHERDIRLIMDLALNHTSDQHDWFQASRADPDGPYGDYYIWREGDPDQPPNNWKSIFGGSAWTYDEEREAHYLHLFHESQPDLNWEHPPVREDLYDVMAWWAERGVDGYRLDVINLLSKAPGLPDGDPDASTDYLGGEHFIDGPRIHEFLGAMDRRVFEPHDIMTVGELVDGSVERAREYVGADGPLDLVFNFDHLKVDYGERGRWDVDDLDLVEFKAVLSAWQDGLGDEGWNSVFLNNHDQPRSLSRFGDPDRYRRESATLLATLVLTLRGTPFLYQGEEIGMTNHTFGSLEELHDVDTIQNVRALMDERGVDSFEAVRDVVNYRSRDHSRTPMQWTDGPNGGFTRGEPWLPVNGNYETVNVERAVASSDSVWSYYRDLIDLRASMPVLIYGDYRLHYASHPTVFAYERRLDDVRLFVALNLSDEQQAIDLPADERHDEASDEVAEQESDGRDERERDEASLVVGNYDDTAAAASDHIELRPYEARIYRL